MSDTPRTDAIIHRLHGRSGLFCDDDSLAQYNDLVDLALTMERELASPRVEARPRDGICKGCGKFVAFQDICARDERTGHNDYHVECVPK